MTPERWLQVKDILAAAVSMQAGDRAVYLTGACGGDADLSDEVQSLLASHEAAGIGFLETPPLTLAEDPGPLSSIAARVGRRIGVYDIVGELGHGGMGEVYRAVRADGHFHKEVALKLVRGGLDSRFVVERFRNERQILAGLDHPNIARLLDGGTTDEGLPFLVMELVDGVPIDAYCDGRRLSIDQRLRLFRKVCSAVQYAHQRLIIHRDLKPGNILVTSDGMPKLLDFGIAKILDPAAVTAVTLARPMTVDYASPEQIQGGALTTATDVYSLGVVLYRLLTGHSPYAPTTASQLSRAIVEADPVRPSTVIHRSDATAQDSIAPEDVGARRSASAAALRRRLAGDLDTILMMALRKEPERRYLSVEAFSEDLRAHLEDRPVAARKDSWRYRARKFAIRHRVPIVALAAVVALLAAGAVAIVHEARLARREAALADAERARAERRFADVRQLSDALIFEFHDAIQNLPGATPARKLLLDRAVQYLDRLASDSGGDIALQRDLAWGYQRLAVVQGSPNESNLGDATAAEASNRKATALFEAVARGNPSDVTDQLNVAMSHRRIAFAGLASGAGRGDLEKAMAITARLQHTDPSNLKVKSERSIEYQDLALLQDAAGDRVRALDAFEKNLALKREMLAGGYPSMPRGMAMAIVQIGDELTRVGRLSDALEAQQSAMKWYEQATAGHDIGSLREMAVARLFLSDTQVMLGQTAASAATVRQARSTLESMAQSDPQNAMLRVDVAGVAYREGRALAIQGKYVEAIVALDRSIDGFEAGSQHPDQDGDIALDAAAALIWRGDAYARRGDASNALTSFRKATSILEVARKASALNRDGVCALATGMNRAGEILLARGQLADAGAAFDAARALVDTDALVEHGDVPALYAAADALTGLADVATTRARTTQSRAEQAALRGIAKDQYARSQQLQAAIPTRSRVTPIGLAASRQVSFGS